MYRKETNDYEGYIYIIKNIINNKIYIGQTMRNIDVRYKEHIRHSKTYKNNSKNKHKILYKAMNKYGIENFIYKQYIKCNAKDLVSLRLELNKLEIESITKNNCLVPYGYNMSQGGNFDGCMGGNRRSVAQYDLSGKLIEIFNSLTDAYQKTNYSSLYSGDIEKYLIGGYQWRYIDDISNFTKNIEPYQQGLRTKRIIQVDFNGNFVKEYNSIGMASYETGINNVLIGDCVAKRYNRLSAGGYQWFQIDYGIDIDKIEFPQYTINKTRNLNGFTKRKVNMYSLNDVYLKTFNTTVDASLYINKNESNISNCCNYRQKTSGGYKWYYANDDKQPDKTKIII